LTALIWRFRKTGLCASIRFGRIVSHSDNLSFCRQAASSAARAFRVIKRQGPRGRMAEDASSGVSETANPVALALADASRAKADAAGKRPKRGRISPTPARSSLRHPKNRNWNRHRA
jgi:hypothetical protein